MQHKMVVVLCGVSHASAACFPTLPEKTGDGSEVRWNLTAARWIPVPLISTWHGDARTVPGPVFCSVAVSPDRRASFSSTGSSVSPLPAELVHLLIRFVGSSVLLNY